MCSRHSGAVADACPELRLATDRPAAALSGSARVWPGRRRRGCVLCAGDALPSSRSRVASRAHLKSAGSRQQARRVRRLASAAARLRTSFRSPDVLPRLARQQNARMPMPLLVGHLGVMGATRPGQVFAAADVHYPGSGGARAALVIAADPEFSVLVDEITAKVREVPPCQAGQFYLRELPPQRAASRHVARLGLLNVDGDADLDAAGRRAWAHAEFGVPVIGVAKAAFRTARHAVPVLRGRSPRPLYVTSAGMPPDQAASLVWHMAGPYRLPDALRRADAPARTGHPTPPSALSAGQADGPGPDSPGERPVGQALRSISWRRRCRTCCMVGIACLPNPSLSSSKR
jgi:deoxyribonuclease V